jgi:hypothetical protein
VLRKLGVKSQAQAVAMAYRGVDAFGAANDVVARLPQNAAPTVELTT